MKDAKICFGLLTCLLSGLPTQAQGTTRSVLPYGFASQSGNEGDPVFIGASERFQWFRSEYLAQIWSGPVSLSEIAFRVDERAVFPPNFDATVPRVEIWLSITDRDAANLGSWGTSAYSDVKQVFAADGVRLVSPGGAGPNPFGLRFRFNDAYEYNPADGHLFMRIVTFGDVDGSELIDSHRFEVPLSQTPIAGAGYTFSHPNPSSRGIVTEFTWALVPEPSVLNLACLSGILYSLRKNRTQSLVQTRYEEAGPEHDNSPMR